MPKFGHALVHFLKTTIDEKFDPSRYDGGAGFDFRTKVTLLSAALEMAVPFHYLELDKMSSRMTKNEFWTEIQQSARICSQMIGEKGDLLMFRGKKPGQTAEVFNALARGIAILSFAPGGVSLFGCHYEREAKWVDMRKGSPAEVE